MCWRGHDPRRIKADSQCMDCHAIRVRAYRHGRQPRRAQRYVLVLPEFRRHAKVSARIIAELAGVPLPTLQCWIYRQVATSRDKAQAVAEALRVEFGTLWREVNTLNRS